MRVPFFKQHTSYTCGPACMKMIMKYFGKNFTEKHLKKFMKTLKKDGTEHFGMINCAVKKGFYCYVHKNAGINQIKHYIDLKLPVIVNFIAPDGEGHYAVVVAYDKNNLILNDPYFGKKTITKIKQFEKKWHSKYNKSRRWIMVLSRKDFDLGREYNPIAKDSKN